LFTCVFYTFCLFCWYLLGLYEQHMIASMFICWQCCMHWLVYIFCKLGMLHAVGWQFHGTDFGKRKCHTLRSLDSEFMNIWRQKERNRKRRSTLQSDTVITLSNRSASYYMSWLFFIFWLSFWIIVILKIVHIWNWLSFHSVGSMWKYMSLHFQYICVW